ncbi:MAG: hypothetical protein QNK24_15715, partial [Desulfuromusa sp.]|nr:hypothetical protein [Desulfuromusa sp.]
GKNLPHNYEDRDFVSSSLPEVKQIIRERNEQYDMCGWKYPAAANYLDQVARDLRAPQLIIVFRDVVATMQHHVRSNSFDAMTVLSRVMLQHQMNVSIAMRWNAPTLLVSYEKAIMSPISVVSDLANFVGVPVPEDMSSFEAFLKPGKYKTFGEQG